MKATTNNCTYNDRSEVVFSRGGAEDSYAYDGIGNLLDHVGNGFTNTYAANCLNQYTSVSNLCVSMPLREPSYDPDGNLLTNGVFSYTYDASSRLASVSSNGTLLATFAYDAQGRRVRNYGGFDPFLYVSECEVSVSLSIRILYNLANAPRKTTYTYHPHTVFGGKLRDAYTSTVDGSLPLKGEVIAHERGHAKAFVLHTKPKFDSYVAKYSCPLSQSEQKEIKRLFAKARKETRTENAEMANDASRNWFKCNGFAENAYEGIHGTQFYDYSK